MIDAFIFDVDGTLIDSNAQHAQAWADAFRAHGREIPVDKIRRQIGKGGDQLMPVFLSKKEIAQIGKKLEKDRGEIFKRCYLPSIVAFPDVRKLFEQLHRDGKRLALASSAKGDELQRYKQIARIADLVDEETTSDDAQESKPEPDIFLAVLERLRKTPASAIVVGDTPYDCEGAAKAGLRTIGLRCGGWTEAELRAAGAVAVYRNPADLLDRYLAAPARVAPEWGGS